DGIRDRNVTGVQTCALPICVHLGVKPVADEPCPGWSSEASPPKSRVRTDTPSRRRVPCPNPDSRAFWDIDDESLPRLPHRTGSLTASIRRILAWEGELG